MSRSGQRFKSVRQLLDNYDLDDTGKYISQEFQDYGYRLAVELDDLENKSLYIKLAKETERKLLEQARTFVKDAENVRSKGRLFMWKLGQLKKEVRNKKQEKGKKK